MNILIKVMLYNCCVFIPNLIPYLTFNVLLDDEVDSLPLLGSIGPVLTILATYLVFVLKIGPALMTKRQPFKLNTTLLLYNGIQVVISVYLVQRVSLLFFFFYV